MVWKYSVPKGGWWTKKLKIGSFETLSDVRIELECPTVLVALLNGTSYRESERFRNIQGLV